MGVVIEICAKYPGGPTRNRRTDIYIYIDIDNAIRHTWPYCVLYVPVGARAI
jgi:hypothetical protein